MTSADQSPRQVSDKERRKGRISFIVLVVIFFAPLAAAWLIYFGLLPGKPSGIKANGELIQPPALLEVNSPDYLVDPQEDALLRGKWSLVFVADQCELTCEESLVLMRQVRLSLGRYHDRISRALIVAQVPGDMTRLTDAFPGMDIVHSNSLVDQITSASNREPGKQIYLVDPLGNLTMMFAHDSEPRPMYDDLKHLLKISRIG